MKKILIIENDQQFAERIADALIFNGYVVCIAGNGQEHMFGYRPDLVISNGLVPREHAVHAEPAGQDPMYRNLPVILLLDEAGEKKVSHEKNAGIDMCLKKDDSFDELVLSVTRLLK